MKTNVAIELTDTQRNILADILDEKRSKRLATRSDVNDLLVGIVAGMIDREIERQKYPAPTPTYIQPEGLPIWKSWRDDPILITKAKEIEAGFKTKKQGITLDGYRRGWTIKSTGKNQ